MRTCSARRPGFHALLDACRDSRAEDDGWGFSHATVRVVGRVLHEMLADVGDLRRPYHKQADNQRSAAFRAGAPHGKAAATSRCSCPKGLFAISIPAAGLLIVSCVNAFYDSVCL
jgi:hypothetical protein